MILLKKKKKKHFNKLFKVLLCDIVSPKNDIFIPFLFCFVPVVFVEILFCCCRTSEILVSNKKKKKKVDLKKKGQLHFRKSFSNCITKLRFIGLHLTFTVNYNIFLFNNTLNTLACTLFCVNYAKNLKIFFFAENCPQRKCVKFLACVCRSRATVFKQKLARASYERFHGYSSGVSVFRCFDAKFRFRFQFRTIQGRLS
jgi:hypothetical protein